jgi:hypothetical protein
MTNALVNARGSTRRHDLDWLRVAAFALLIFYHIGMFYVTWDWHIKSRHASTLIETPRRAGTCARLSVEQDRVLAALRTHHLTRNHAFALPSRGKFLRVDGDDLRLA